MNCKSAGTKETIHDTSGVGKASTIQNREQGCANLLFHFTPCRKRKKGIYLTPNRPRLERQYQKLYYTTAPLWCAVGSTGMNSKKTDLVPDIL